mgnify:CR=1 FL=1
MSGKRYTDEFKAEAIKQVIERGYTVKEVAERLGVSSHSLYEWVRRARGKQRGRKSDELDLMREENARLKAELRRAEEERDILKKAAAYFAKG